MPDLVARLAGLHATLSARLTLRESLLSLSGRLDMVLQQVDLRASAAPAPLAHGGKKGKVPAGKAGAREPRRYVEGESEQEEEAAEAMEVELEEASDAGSVEDVELGAESMSEAEDDGEEEDDDDDEDENEDEDEDDGVDEDDSEDSGGDEGPWLNGFVDDEAEEADEDEESESE